MMSKSQGARLITQHPAVVISHSRRCPNERLRQFLLGTCFSGIGGWSPTEVGFEYDLDADVMVSLQCQAGISDGFLAKH